jgi:hypothetical protein
MSETRIAVDNSWAQRTMLAATLLVLQIPQRDRLRGSRFASASRRSASFPLFELHPQKMPSSPRRPLPGLVFRSSKSA